MADKSITPPPDKPEEDFEAVLPLPIEGYGDKTAKKKSPEVSGNPALDLIRKKMVNVYSSEPDVAQEEEGLEEAGKRGSLSKHQRFLKELGDSGKSLPQMQSEWHEYYAGLPDEQKRQVWQEFDEYHKTRSSYTKEQAAAKSHQPHPAAFKPVTKRRSGALQKVIKEAKKQAAGTLEGAKNLSPNQSIRSLGFGLIFGLITVFIFLFGFFNERFIAPFIQPSRAATTASLITGSVSKAPELIIPKINLQVPVVYGVTSTEEDVNQKALEKGVLHYADTALPGQNGNIVIVGHSSNNILNPGKYKFAFVLLHKLQSGDTFYLQKDGKRYVYEVYKRQVVAPTDTSVLGLRDQPATATLITCDPPGTSAKRLVVVGKQISPAVATNKKTVTRNVKAVASTKVPGNSPSLWSRLYAWLSR